MKKVLICLIILLSVIPCLAENYHVLATSEKDHESVVVFHIAVPNENNAVSVNLRIALTQYKPFTTSIVPYLSTSNPTEFEALQAGQIYEYQETVSYNANLNILQKRGIIDARYTVLSTSIPNIIRATLRFWGLDRNVQ